MNTVKLLLIAVLFSACIVCSEQGRAEQQSASGKHDKGHRNQLAESSGKTTPGNPPESQKVEGIAHTKKYSEARFCDGKDKVDVGLWPEASTIKSAKFAVPNPAFLTEQGVDLKDEEQFKRNAEKVSSVLDLNSDKLPDLITAGYCTGGNGCMYSIYINCGNKCFYHMSKFDPYALGIKVNDNPESHWKLIRALNQDADSSSLDEGQDVIYKFVGASYQPIRN